MNTFNLAQIIEKAQSDPEVFGIIRRHASGILTSLGMNTSDARQWLTEKIFKQSITDLFLFEKKLFEDLKQFGIYEQLPSRMQERAQEWFTKIEPYMLRSTTLDLGGGSGEIAQLMQRAGCTVSLADVFNWSKYNFPFFTVEENHIDSPQESFDQVVVLTVFHHTHHPAELLQEAFRLAKKRVIFIESVTENLVGYLYGAWIDWFYNHVIHYNDDPGKKINVPCNFLPATGWEQLVWKFTQLKPKFSTNLGIHQELNPENHQLFIYDK